MSVDWNDMTKMTNKVKLEKLKRYQSDTPEALLADLRKAGLTVEVSSNNRLAVRPHYLLTDDLRARVKKHKDGLVQLLNGDSFHDPEQETAAVIKQPEWPQHWPLAWLLVVGAAAVQKQLHPEAEELKLAARMPADEDEFWALHEAYYKLVKDKGLTDVLWMAATGRWPETKPIGS